MFIKASTQLSDHTFQVSTPLSTHLVVVGDAVALVDAGAAATSSYLIEELQKFLADGRDLKCVLITHSHFDHVGGLVALRRFAPEVKVVGSPLCAERLADVEYLKSCFDKDQKLSAAMGSDFPYSFEEWQAGVRLDHLVSEGDGITIGEGVDIKAVNLPGHTADLVGYFVRPDSALAAAEAVGGYHGRDKIGCAFLSSRTDYIASLDKIMKLDIKVLNLPHSGTLTGELVQKFLLAQRQAAEQFPDRLNELIQSGSVREEIIFDMLNDWAVEGISPEGPLIESQRELIETMVNLTLAELPAADTDL